MDSKEIKLLAMVAAGTKRKKRTVNILKVAEALRKLQNSYGSLNTVSSSVKLSPEMIREFLKLLGLTNRAKELIRKGLIDSVDIGYRMSKLSETDQFILAKTVLKERLSSGDVRGIVKYRVDNPHMPINKVIKHVLESKVKKIFVAYLGIDKDMFDNLGHICGKKDKETLIKSLFNKILGKANISFFALNGRVVVIKVSQKGLTKLKNQAKRMKVTLAKLANELVKEYLGGLK